MPPKHDLRGGQKSADSFAMSSNIFPPSINRCFVAAESHEVANVDDSLDSYMNLVRCLLYRQLGALCVELRA